MVNTSSNIANSYLIHHHRRLFSVYIYYRLGMSVLLGALFLSGLGQSFLGINQPTAFLATSYVYIGFCSLSLLLYLLDMVTTKAKHILFLLLVDFVALTLMIYSSNHAIGGLGYLLLIPMAIGSTFLNGKTSVALAAFSSLLIMSTSIFHSLDSNEINTQSLFTAGITGIVLFITAIAFRLLTKKIQSNEYLIQQQIEHTYYIQNIAQRIIETIQAGIVVIDSSLNILFINQTAQELLSGRNDFRSLKDIEILYRILLKWKTHKTSPETIAINLGINHNIKISFTLLTEDNITSLMLFIEDERSLKKEAQQLKLASLGRLTSSIAHEIRNPLSAINHASQLLDESEHIQRGDQELLSIIQMNAQRIDQTINNILQFSQRKKANSEAININQWLEKFSENYQLHSKSNIIFNTQHKKIYCKMDPHHLQQIITNLVDNGLRHSNKDGAENFITIETHIYSVTNFPYINIIDEGEGIDDSQIDTIFEPFYTTKSTGSGLGLYLCKELCQANQADIVHFPKTQKQKSCFRLILCQAQQKTDTYDQ